MDFRLYIQHLAKRKSRVLEIGPSYNPILPKAEGYQVSIMDHANRSELVEKYAAFDVDTSRIEDVDYVTTDLASIKSTGHRFDLVVASHVIEHVTDFIKFLNDCESLLVEGGQLALIVPDKRHCFDFFRPVTTPGAMVDAYCSKRTLHVGGLFDHYSYFCRNKGQMAWGDVEDVADLEFIHTADMTMDAVNKPLLSGDYSDAHEWVFVPASFAFALAELRGHGFVNLGIDQAYATLGYEFLAILSTRAPVESRTKAQLLFEIQHEVGAAFYTRSTHSEKEPCFSEDLTRQVSENRRLTDVIAQQKKQLDSLYSSTSWRLTLPLRLLREFVSR
ncbi:methyltransferase domain-containing protein [Pseudomonas phytophila]|uniref:Methyltransferase domain-containing protein n=1 Tax=Pseudomonas phytophila TaxID=2867264 RepID=A0ABY6FCX4_9PSED|nr:methyltransferase domain-containing protein [Pseudomonas phytophila]UXZ95714.1 methyltransferase domain-containing protein [Pseudomonas phytophila]